MIKSREFIVCFPLQSWDARLLMERSRAVKCPDISAHLAGTKKVQFFPDQPQAVQQIRATLADLYTLDMGPERDKTVSVALSAAERFVLKSQREGGGTAGGGIEASLKMLKTSVCCSPFVKLGKFKQCMCGSAHMQHLLIQVVSRLWLTNLTNECVGRLLRTKSSGQSDGGVAAGVTVLNNPLLS
uniref:Uncharacterized protein n=1 Tax=Maylandia zebra TaxID=106582 RepID=A0A3P9BRQ7_9CICH